MNGLATMRRLKERRQAKAIASATQEAFGRLQSRLSYVESVACGFAWDLVVRAKSAGLDYAANDALDMWDESLRELRRQHEESL